MEDGIILATLNARYTHASLGLRYIHANLGPRRKQAKLMEFTIAMRPLDIAEQLLAAQPRIIGLGVYIWNVAETTELVSLLKSLEPNVVIVLGGPEVSHETGQQTIISWADYVITGPGEISFRQLCDQLLSGQKPLAKVIAGIQPPLEQLELPYTLYTDEDLATRSIYVEASRGCPFKCEFCLSALDKTAWPFDLQRFLSEMEALWQRGLRQFRFVDRTFNLKIQATVAILDFFLERLDADTFLHFELIPDYLPEALKERVSRFPAGSLQFEIGVQTFDPAVQALISRKQDNARAAENIRWLREHSGAHLHTDLIFGLPGEDLEGFGAGFDQLVRLNPHEIQVGILKRLRGAPIRRHTEAFGLVFNPLPPYNILRTDRVDFATMQHMNRFARYWDMIGNSGRFTHALPLLLGEEPFARFWKLTAWIHAQAQQTHQIALPRLFVLVHGAGLEALGLERRLLEEALLQDYALTGQKGQIPFLAEARRNPFLPKQGGKSGNQRQLRFLGQGEAD
ncbi:DUF4080 domain-containing protein [Candidatus Thiothrix sp. Deng01]|uniref:DUF4080 domain-containing protein n=1 Tax=Candidatus Thiothrix phosphatis TaxID=3112415 RepID=A0ABU6CWC0_9GAMM|nr:DUF4080 domain-containing protein [Candidatus Thiothrix sp. Deng01]MEB4590837.1 DUF4080 domain-containing protein [Candidatus Thiothrix sp. Deng01]